MTRTIFKTGLLQSLDIADELIKILEEKKSRSYRNRAEYLEEKIEELIRSYCKRVNYTPQYIRENKK